MCLLLLTQFSPLYSAAQIELLQLLVQIASENNLGEGVIVKIKFNIIASLYDYNPNLATYMKVRAILASQGGADGSWEGASCLRTQWLRKAPGFLGKGALEASVHSTCTP